MNLIKSLKHYIIWVSSIELKIFWIWLEGIYIFRPFWDSSESLPRSNWRALIELRVEEARQADRVEEISRGTKQDWNDSYNDILTLQTVLHNPTY